MEKKNKKSVLIVAIVFFLFLGLLVGLWYFLSFSKFGYERRLWIDGVITEVAVRLRPIPIYFFPYPRYVVEDGKGNSYYYAFVKEFKRQTEDDAMAKGQIIASSAILQTLDGKEKQIDVYDTSTGFNYLIDGMGLFLREINYESGRGIVDVVGRGVLSKRPLFFKAENLRFNLRVGDFVRVSVTSSGKYSVYWLGTKMYFY